MHEINPAFLLKNSHTPRTHAVFGQLTPCLLHSPQNVAIGDLRNVQKRTGSLWLFLAKFQLFITAALNDVAQERRKNDKKHQRQEEIHDWPVDTAHHLPTCSVPCPTVSRLTKLVDALLTVTVRRHGNCFYGGPSSHCILVTCGRELSDQQFLTTTFPLFDSAVRDLYSRSRLACRLSVILRQRRPSWSFQVIRRYLPCDAAKTVTLVLLTLD